MTVNADSKWLSESFDTPSGRMDEGFDINGVVFHPTDDSTSTFTITLEPSQSSYLYSFKTNLTEVFLTLSSAHEVLATTFNVISDSFGESLGYTNRYGAKQESGEFQLDFYNKQSLIKRKVVDYDQDSIDTISVIPMLYFLSKQGLNQFDGHMIIQHMTMKVPIHIFKTVTSDILSMMVKYRVPSQLIQRLKGSNKEVMVYILSVKGWRGFFYNSNHFYLFTNEPNPKYVGHWGGQNDTNLFFFDTNFFE